MKDKPTFRTTILHHSFFFCFLVCEAVGTAATPGLLCQPRVIVKMIVEKQMECRLAGKAEVLLGKNLPQRHFCPSQNPTWPDPDLNPGRRGGNCIPLYCWGTIRTIYKFMLVFYLSYFSNLIMEIRVCSSETSIAFQRTLQCQKINT
jgi:hypothetical protein